MNSILEKAVEVDADAIGLSALLVSTSKQMPICVKEQDARGLAFPVIVGGAAINRDFGRRIAFVDDERLFEPGVFYAKDAFEGLEIVDRLTRRPRRAKRSAARCSAEARAARERRRAAQAPVGSDGRTARATLAYADAPAPPFSGARVVDDVDVRDALAVLRPAAASIVFRGAARTPKGRPSNGSCATSSSRAWPPTSDAPKRGGVLRRKVVYGYFPAAGLGDDVIVYDPADPRARDRALPVPAPSRRRASVSRRLPARTAGRRRERRRRAAGRHDRPRASRSAIEPRRPPATTANRTSCTASPCRPPRRSPSTMHRAHSARARPRSRARQTLLVGLRRLPRPRTARRSSGACSTPSAAIGAQLTEAFQIVPEQSTAAIVDAPSAGHLLQRRSGTGVDTGLA